MDRSGKEDMFECARKHSKPVNNYIEVPEAYSAIYIVNDIGKDRVVPIFNSEEFKIVGGVFDSNPGYSQRYTPWDTEFSGPEIEDEVEKMDAEVTELKPRHIVSIEQLNEEGVAKFYTRLTGLSEYFMI